MPDAFNTLTAEMTSPISFKAFSEAPSKKMMKSTKTIKHNKSRDRIIVSQSADFSAISQSIKPDNWQSRNLHFNTQNSLNSIIIEEPVYLN